MDGPIMASIISTKTSGGGGIAVTGDTSGILQLASNDGTTAVTIDASQNVGVGIAPSAWNSPIKAVQVNTATLWSNTSNTNVFSSNVLRGSAYAASYIGTGFAGEFGFNLNGVGEWAFSTAPSGSSGAACTLTERMRIDSSGSLILAGSTAQKATGTTWSNPSDFRLKDNITDYSKGLNELLQINVKEWVYNGKGNTTKGMKGLGVIADEVMQILPNTVDTYKAKLNSDDEDNTDIKKFDATEITWLMLNSIKEQQAIITDLKARIEVLEGAQV
jgi:hypothetical protein